MFPQDLHSNRVRQPRDVPAGMGEAGDQPSPNGLDDPHHDDGDGAGGLLGGTDLVGPNGHEEVNLATHEFRRESRCALVPPLRIPALDDEVLALDIPALPQPLHPCLPDRTALYWAMLGGCICGSGQGVCIKPVEGI